ncbi:MAG: hypothetical protein IMZ64_12020, partial [Bacteroidetes bacterium]|nr:hypothetical protein [Bacteroidota bacterium]
IPYGLSLTAQPGGNNITISSNITSSGATGYGLISSGTAILVGSDNITLIQDGNRLAIKGAAQGGVQTGISGIVASDATYASGTIRMSAQNNITIGSFVTSDSQYVRFSVGNYITTGAVSDHTHGSNIVFGSTTNSTENIVRASSSSNGITMVVPAYLTTAMQSASSSVFAKTGFTTQSTSGTDIVGTLNSSGLNLGVPKYLVTGAFLTTAAQVSHSHGNPTLSLANLSGATASASNGLTLSLTGYPATSFVNVSDTHNIYFANSLGSNITWGSATSSNATYIYATAGGGSGGAGAVTFSAGAYSASLASLVFSNSNGLGFGLNGSTLTGSYTVPSGAISFNDAGGITWGTASGSNSTITVVTASVNPAGGGAGTGTTVGATNGTQIKMTLNGTGLNMSVPAYLTTAAQAVTFSAGANSGALSSLVFSNSNGVGFGLNGSTITASYTVPGVTVFSNDNSVTFGLTGSTLTANFSQSTHSHAGVGSVYYNDTNGVTFGASTSGSSTTITASINAVSAGAGSGYSSTTTAGTAMVGTLNSNGLSLGIPAWITVGGSGGGGNWATSAITGSGISILTGAATNTLQYGPFVTAAAAPTHTHGSNVSISATSNATENVMRFSSSSNGLTVVVPSYLTTAANSTHNHNTQYAGILATAITGGTATINSSEIKINFSANVGSIYFSDVSGFSWGTSTSGSSTTVYIITA